jgi:uncharacterized protein (TIGR03086 family)
VRDLVSHVVTTHRRVLGVLHETAPEEPEEDLLKGWEAARARVIDALDDPATAAKTVAGPFGEQPFESLVGRLLCADTLFHTWDLARATRQDEHLDEESVSKAIEFLGPIDESIRRPGGFGPKIAPPPGADAQTCLLCFGGRAVSQTGGTA